jgi:hypothetical protein
MEPRSSGRNHPILKESSYRRSPSPRKKEPARDTRSPGTPNQKELMARPRTPSPMGRAGRVTFRDPVDEGPPLESSRPPVQLTPRQPDGGPSPHQRALQADQHRDAEEARMPWWLKRRMKQRGKGDQGAAKGKGDQGAAKGKGKKGKGKGKGKKK